MCWFLAFLLVYPWVVLDPFSGAVAQHILPASFTTCQVVKINLFLLALRLGPTFGTGITKGAQELKLLK